MNEEKLNIVSGSNWNYPHRYFWFTLQLNDKKFGALVLPVQRQILKVSDCIAINQNLTSSKELIPSKI